MKGKSGIYLITSPSQRLYVGQAKDLSKRLASYRLGGSKNQRRLYRSLQKHGFKAHSFEVIIYCPVDELNAWEAFYIKLFDTFGTEHGLNLRSGGGVSLMSAETLNKMREAQKGKVVSQETRLKFSKALKGRNVDEEVKIRISKTLTGLPKTKEHIAAALKGRVDNGSMLRVMGNLHEQNKKKIINTITGEVYNSASEAYPFSGYSYSGFTTSLRNRKYPNPQFKYL